jgi:hypothetical protein
MDIAAARRRCALPLVLGIVLLLLMPIVAWGQIGFPIDNAPGVIVDPDGTVKRRAVDEREELAGMRARMQAAQAAGKNEKLAYVSLPKVFATAHSVMLEGKAVPEEIQYLGGLTQIRYVFLYTESNDLVIAGPHEAVQVVDGEHAVGKTTGRPVMRLEDLVVAMRVVRDAGRTPFGCRLDPDPAAPDRIRQTMAEMARSSRAERIKAVAKATGPQKVSFFGRVPEDTRFATVMIAADYELKRYGLGLAHSTIPDLGTIVDNSRAAVNMIWYELAYDPILVSTAADAYGLRGPRLKIQAGSFDWDPKGATPKAFEFARKMSRGIETLAINQPLIADLQNLADLSVVAALIERDKLAEKAHWNTGWLMQGGDDAKTGFPVAKVTTPKTADALSNYSNGSIAAGGVVLSPLKLVQTAEVDAKHVLNPLREAGQALRSDGGGAAVLPQP